MRTRYLLAALLSLLLFGGVLAQKIEAQSFANNPPDIVGPELAFFDKGAQDNVNRDVLVANNFTGSVQVINQITEGTPYNPSPQANVTLRLAGIKFDTPDSLMVEFAQKLNGSDAFPPGTIVIVGNELNNLTDREYFMPGAVPNSDANLRAAARRYAEQYNAFARAITNHSKYKIAPAPPDLYNGDWNPVPWVSEFRTRIDCGATDALIANVFDVPSRVGLPPLQTHQYLERNICPQKGLKVTRFGGWGTQPDRSVKEQVDFYNNTPLPSGVTAATTLIPDNCDGRRGNQEFRWLYYIRGKVFRSDGTEVNPETCLSGAFNPQDTARVKCPDRSDPNFHSLRPYPGSACNEAVEQTSVLCGHDLIVKQRFSVTPSEAKSCTPKDDGSQDCFYEFENSVNTTVDLTEATLPIMGNTELVPNSKSNSNSLSSEQRVNEYVSWYLNGVNYRAEEEYSGQPVLMDQIVNFSGPLYKLLPWRVQVEYRMKQVADAAQSVHNNAKIRHDQIIGCYFLQLSAYSQEIPIGCYQPLNAGTFRRPEWLTAWDTFKPPLEENFNSISSFWNAYKRWRGSICTNPILVPVINKEFYLCTGGQTPIYGLLFPYIPSSSTEDLKGLAKSGYSSAVPSADQGNVNITELIYKPTQESDVLYFPHMKEDTELAEILQKTYAPGGEDLFFPNQPPPPQFTNFCEILETKTNPGDDLKGEFNEFNEEKQITGTITYKANFTCNFPPPKLRDGCIEQCILSGRTVDSCGPECTDATPECKKDGITVLSLITHTPKAWEAWQRLVNGTMGTFKRFFPKIGPDAPISEIIPYPAKSFSSYGATDAGGTLSADSTEALAGELSKNRSGAEAELYFPFIGGIHEYFLQTLQMALRPQGLSPRPDNMEAGVSSTSPNETAGGCTERTCKPLWEGVPTSGWPGPIQTAIREASQKWSIPECILTGIASVEGSKMRLLSDLEASVLTQTNWGPNGQEQLKTIPHGNTTLYNWVNCSPNSASATGPMQVVSSVWSRHKGASGAANPNVCNARDAIHAVAKFLTTERLPIYGYPAGSSWTETRKFCAAGETFYGSCRLDTPTCNNLGGNYCDFIANHCGKSLPAGVKTCYKLVNPTLIYRGDACFLPVGRF